MSVLRVRLFGKFEMLYGEQVLISLDPCKTREMFCYLLLHRGHPHSREALAGLLWNEKRTDQPIRCLRKTLWQLRMGLDSQTEQLSDRVLLIESDWVQLNPKADLWLDVAMFEDAYDRVQGKPGRGLEPHCVETLRSAVDLYRGGLQENWYHDWYLYERERFQYMYLSMLDKLMDYCEANGNYEAGIAYGTLILRCERARERTHRRLMRLHYLAGDRTASLRQYGQCVAALKEELGVKPASRTMTLYQHIRSDQFATPALIPAQANTAPERSISSLSEVLGHLKRLRMILDNVQHQVDQDIQIVEQILSDQH